MVGFHRFGEVYLDRGFGGDVGHHVVLHGGQGGDELVDELVANAALPHADLLVLVRGEHFVADHHHGLDAALPKAELGGNIRCVLLRRAKLSAVGAAVEHLVGGESKREDVAVVAWQHRHASIGLVVPGLVAVLLRVIGAAALVSA